MTHDDECGCCHCQAERLTFWEGALLALAMPLVGLGMFVALAQLF